jgi:hypothetical protein
MLEPQRVRINLISLQNENHFILVVTMLEHRTMVKAEVFIL